MSYSPADMARTLEMKRDEAKYQLEAELSTNHHFVFDKDCDHHCSDCCPGLYLQYNV